MDNVNAIDSNFLEISSLIYNQSQTLRNYLTPSACSGTFQGKVKNLFCKLSFSTLHESSVGLSSTTNPSLGVAIPVPAQTHLYTHAKGRAT